MKKTVWVVLGLMCLICTSVFGEEGFVSTLAFSPSTVAANSEGGGLLLVRHRKRRKKHHKKRKHRRHRRHRRHGHRDRDSVIRSPGYAQNM